MTGLRLLELLPRGCHSLPTKAAFNEADLVRVFRPATYLRMVSPTEISLHHTE